MSQFLSSISDRNGGSVLPSQKVGVLSSQKAESKSQSSISGRGKGEGCSDQVGRQCHNFQVQFSERDGGILSKSEDSVTISKFNFRKRQGVFCKVRRQSQNLQDQFQKEMGGGVLTKSEDSVTISKFNFRKRLEVGVLSSQKTESKSPSSISERDGRRVF